jgi:hypothetical protein
MYGFMNELVTALQVLADNCCSKFASRAVTAKAGGQIKDSTAGSSRENIREIKIPDREVILSLQ